MKEKWVLSLAATLVAAGLLYFAYIKGQSRNVFIYKQMDAYLPVPILFDSYAGTGTIVAPNKIRVRWDFPIKPENPSQPYFLCIGTASHAKQIIYLLELDGRIYLEKQEHIEPLIRALGELCTGVAQGTFDKISIEEVLTVLPEDRDFINQTALKIKPVKHR